MGWVCWVQSYLLYTGENIVYACLPSKENTGQSKDTSAANVGFDVLGSQRVKARCRHAGGRKANRWSERPTLSRWKPQVLLDPVMQHDQLIFVATLGPLLAQHIVCFTEATTGSWHLFLTMENPTRSEKCGRPPGSPSRSKHVPFNWLRSTFTLACLDPTEESPLSFLPVTHASCLCPGWSISPTSEMGLPCHNVWVFLKFYCQQLC